MKKKNGFTLIELLAVIIILGILMIIAIPSVTKYINDSRKNAYIDTAKQVGNSAKNLVNSGALEMYDTDVAYYIPNSCIKIENGDKAKSPYGNFIDDKTFVVVTYNGQGYDYYWVSLDDTGTGIPEPLLIDRLSEDDIKSDLKNEDIKDNIGVGGRKSVVIFNSTCDDKEKKDAYMKPICIRATELHTEKCTLNSYYCAYDGYVEGNRGTTITYGNLGTNGTLKSGDAFDCDVNGDGIYNSENERFYYVGNYYDTDEKTFNENIGVLIYYNNVPGKNDSHQYNKVNEVVNGPIEAIRYLPSASNWKNVTLFKDNRQILTYNGGNIANSQQLSKLNYSGYSSRIITYAEVVNSCDGYREGVSRNMSKCLFYFENTNFSSSNNSVDGIWTESPSLNSTGVYFIDPLYSYLTSSVITIGSSYNTSYNNIPTRYHGVKPVIEMEKSRIEY